MVVIVVSDVDILGVVRGITIFVVQLVGATQVCVLLLSAVWQKITHMLAMPLIYPSFSLGKHYDGSISQPNHTSKQSLKMKFAHAT